MLTGYVANQSSDSGTEPMFPLTFAARGETVALSEIRAGDKLRQRLGDLGLNVGMRVRVVAEGDGSGAMILAVTNDSRLAIGHGMAQKIMVTRCQTCADLNCEVCDVLNGEGNG